LEYNPFITSPNVSSPAVANDCSLMINCATLLRIQPIMFNSYAAPFGACDQIL